MLSTPFERLESKFFLGFGEDCVSECELGPHHSPAKQKNSKASSATAEKIFDDCSAGAHFFVTFLWASKEKLTGGSVLT